MAVLQTLTPEAADDIVDLAERLRDLGVRRFTIGELTVEFRGDVPLVAPAPVVGPGVERELEKISATPFPQSRRDQYKALMGDARFPGAPDEAI